MMKYIPLSRFAASPFSHASRGKGDGTLRAERPFVGASLYVCASFEHGVR